MNRYVFSLRHHSSWPAIISTLNLLMWQYFVEYFQLPLSNKLLPSIVFWPYRLISMIIRQVILPTAQINGSVQLRPQAKQVQAFIRLLPLQPLTGSHPKSITGPELDQPYVQIWIANLDWNKQRYVPQQKWEVSAGWVQDIDSKISSVQP
jgi:hypothetical protein